MKDDYPASSGSSRLQRSHRNFAADCHWQLLIGPATEKPYEYTVMQFPGGCDIIVADAWQAALQECAVGYLLGLGGVAR